MKIVLLNAATLPIYRDELTPLLLEADTSDSAPEAEAFFHELRAALSRNQRLLWIARDEHGRSARPRRREAFRSVWDCLDAGRR
ncbi:hypothetical protein LLS47_24390 [Rouxiella badensis]|uniref:hypothetical protein n=1 Tax=Rouxiella badensis TaxID=1646377 RepID=UPI001D13F2C8|nr:hypothetical protein [Rouxiella badensis]MCC3736035.1 hypothetical protein [Rouxiella badensis]MCC3761432.1 hypothetical protein [Rouxiella badensis]